MYVVRRSALIRVAGAREQGNPPFGMGVEAPPEHDDIPTEKITYQRRKKQREVSVNDSGLRFNASVPVTTIHIKDSQIGKSLPRK